MRTFPVTLSQITKHLQHLKPEYQDLYPKTNIIKLFAKSTTACLSFFYNCGTAIAYIEATKNDMKTDVKIRDEEKQLRYYTYYKCERCGYISIVKNTWCPICQKDGHKLKLK